MAKSKGVIGVFDSGVGGLTVVKAIKEILPKEDICYLADSVNLPYGNKSSADLENVCFENLQFLTEQPLKALVIACNTVSAHLYNTLKQRFNIPIFDVITPAVEEAISRTQNKKIAVLGSESTIQSKVYEKLIAARMPDSEVIPIACPLLVSVIEENLLQHQLSQMLVSQYLAPLQETDVDVVIMGCTHYPLLEKTISEELPEHVDLIDSGLSSVKQLKAYLEKNKLLATKHSENTFFVTGNADSFNRVGSAFLDQKINAEKREH